MDSLDGKPGPVRATTVARRPDLHVLSNNVFSDLLLLTGVYESVIACDQMEYSSEMKVRHSGRDEQATTVYLDATVW